MKNKVFLQYLRNRMKQNDILSTKSHYEVLDALRGVTALLVVWYHIFEGYAFAGGGVITGINHGYLAVDFFFILSGFVLSYAYDERWAKGFTPWQFIKRRLIRLHPMVILGAVIGCMSFIAQGRVQWDGSHIATSAVMLALLLAMFMIPAAPGCPYEVRGNGEMYPLNGPTWSLFFEYLGNIIYMLALRRMSDKALKVLTIILGVCLAIFASFGFSGYGSIGVGWTLDGMNFIGGLLRMLFPFSLGMLIARSGYRCRFKGTFWLCTTVLAAVFFIPFIPYMLPIIARPDGTSIYLSLNGVFESICIILIFPVLLWGGTSSENSGLPSKICKFLGDLSFPLYLSHYPIMYLFYAWLIKTGKFTFAETWQVTICVYISCIILGVLCSLLYDRPIRKRLSKYR